MTTPAHDYLSTGCLHGDHDYCQNRDGQAGPKKPGVCKFCDAKCRCDCHAEAPTPRTENPDAHVCKPDATVYYCPTAGDTESDCHGGFDTCCDRPELHVPIETEVDREALLDHYAEAIRTAAHWCDGNCGMTERKCDDAHPVQVGMWTHGVVTEVSGSPDALAAAVMSVRDREMERLRAKLATRGQST